MLLGLRLPWMIGGKQDIGAKQEIETSKVTHDDGHVHFYPGE